MAEPDPPYRVEPQPVDQSDVAGAAHRRTVLFTAVGALLAAALLFAVITRVTSTRATPGVSTDSAGKRVAQFELGRATDYARTIARQGPILFPDPQGRSRDIFVQHLGDAQWLAFEARASGAPRQCVLKWEGEARRFVDPCDGRIYSADGAGLVSFPTVVNDKGKVIVDLSSPTAPTTTTTAAPITTTTMTAPAP